jgi:hypothetical protein
MDSCQFGQQRDATEGGRAGQAREGTDWRGWRCEHRGMPEQLRRANDLREALAARALEESPAAQEPLYRALARAIVLVPMRTTKMELKETEMFTPTVTGRDGRTSVLAYTDSSLAPQDTVGQVMPFRSLCQQIAQSGLSVLCDSGSPDAGVVPSNWVRAIADGQPDMPNPVTVARTSSRIVTVDRARPASGELRSRLISGFAAYPEISAGYIAFATLTDDAGWLVTATVPSEMPETARRRIATELYAWVYPALTEHEEIYFNVASDPSERELTAATLLYRRS